MKKMNGVKMKMGACLLALGLASCVSSVTTDADGTVTRATSFATVDQIRAAGELAAAVRDTGK